MQGSNRLRSAAVLAVCVAALGFGACGDDDDETTSPATTAETTEGATGATGAEGSADVEALLQQAFVATGQMSEGEATCVAELIAPEVSGEQLTDLQDPAFVESLLTDKESEINECEGE